MIELRKSVPKALLSFEPATLELIKIKAAAAPVVPDAAPIVALPPVATPLALLKPFDPGGGELEPPGPPKTKAQLKRAGKPDPKRFKVNDKVMTLSWNKCEVLLLLQLCVVLE